MMENDVAGPLFVQQLSEQKARGIAPDNCNLRFIIISR